MTKKIWSHFQKSFTWYILIGVIVSLCSALAIYFFQQLLDHYQKSFQLGLLVAYGTTIILIPLLSYCEQKPKAYLTNGIYFYLKKLSLIKMSKISYEEYLKLGAGALLQKVEVGAAAGRNIHLNFYGRLFRELIPEPLFNLFFIALIDKKLLPAILIGYVIVFILTKILLKTLQKMKEKTLISEEAMNATLIRGMTELVTFR
ncbi:ABC transporter ATP-binding protein, partial [Enterococcus faecalis]